MSTDTKQVEHLNMILIIINRLAGNSVQMKTWTVPLVTGIFVFAGLSDSPHWIISIGGCIPIIAFWIMDACYLRLEQCYRKLYEAVRSGANDNSFDLNYRQYMNEVHSVWKLALSWSVGIFYGSLMLLMVGCSVFLAMNQT